MAVDQRLLLTFDENYALPGLVAMHTALQNSPSTVSVTVASVGLSSRSIGRLRRAADGHGRDLSIVEVEQLVESLPSGLPRFRPAAWARIFIDRVTPPETGRIIYLDADTYCRQPISDLFRIELENVPLAAVADPMEPTHALRGQEFWTAARTDPSSGYFNSGVLVIDRSSWVAQDVTGRALEAIAAGRVPTRSVDQDILNAVLADNWSPLPSRWNTYGSATEAAGDASIVHFVGDRKPWHHGCSTGLFEEEYRREAAGLEWRW